MRKVMKVSLVLGALACLPGGVGAQGAGMIVTEGEVAASAEAVWAVWTTSAGLRSWLAPQADVELAVGGMMRANYAGELDGPGTITNEILSYEPARMLSIRVAQAPAGFPFPNAVKRMWTVLYFRPIDGERTHVRIVGMGFADDEESQRMRAFFERGNAYTLEQLQRRFAR
jgi:uncharacterized protein YndB with AHSA1/START domain